MSKVSENLTANESVWMHRLRQRIILERIVLSVGNVEERAQAKKFLDEMEKANPELFADIEHYTPEFFEDAEPQTPELFDASEYACAKGRKTALKLPQDIEWEEKIIRRAVREYRDLFHPCDVHFDNAMKGLQYLSNLHPELFATAREQAIEERDQVLTFEVDCSCECATDEEQQAADSFEVSDTGRLRAVSKRLQTAQQAPEPSDNKSSVNWPFFLDRIREIAPEMLN